MDAACEHIDERLTPYYPTFIREVSKEDILKLMEIKWRVSSSSTPTRQKS